MAALFTGTGLLAHAGAYSAVASLAPRLADWSVLATAADWRLVQGLPAVVSQTTAPLGPAVSGLMLSLARLSAPAISLTSCGVQGFGFGLAD